jgi:hypothetical protein
VTTRARSSSFNFKRSSWLKNCRVNTLGDGVESWSFFDDVPVIQERSTDIFLTLESRLRPEQIADDVYGKPELWWVIALANKVRLPLVELYPGRTLRVPDPNVILAQVRADGVVRG